MHPCLHASPAVLTATGPHILLSSSDITSCIRWVASSATHACTGRALHSTPSNHNASLVLQAFEKASGKEVKYKQVDRRAGDTEAVWAATDTDEKELGWKTKLDLDDMCRDQWAWASKNPKGYES